MNPPIRFTDEELMSYADGVAAPALAARIEQALPQDADVAARLELFRASAQLLRAAFEPVADEPVPERLRQAARGAQRQPPPRRRAGARWRAPLALAAVLASVGVGVLIGIGRPADEAQVAAEVAAVLGEAPRGERRHVQADGRPAEIVVLASYDLDGAFCREYALTDTVTSGHVRRFSCERPDGGWRALAVPDAATPAADEWAPAAGSAGALPAGARPLDENEERARLRGG